MMTQWYFHDADGQKIGPLSDEEFEARVVAGEVEAGTRVWRSGLVNWTNYEALKAHLQRTGPSSPISMAPAAEAVVEVCVAAPAASVPVARTAAPAPAPTYATAVFEMCPQCQKSLPEMLFCGEGTGRLCGNCVRENKSKARSRELSKAKGADSGWFWRHAAKVAVLGVFLGLLRIAVGWMNLESRKASRSMPRELSKMEAWVPAGPANWPQIALVGEADFRSGATLREASAFLIEMADGSFAAVTSTAPFARGTLTPPVPVGEIGGQALVWRFRPKWEPERVVELHRLVGDSAGYRGEEAVLIGAPTAAVPPAQVLRPRRSLPRRGETVFVIAPTPVAGGRQIVAKGKISSTTAGVTSIGTEIAIPAGSIAGAAVIDLMGHLAAIGCPVGVDQKLDANGATQSIKAAPWALTLAAKQQNAAAPGDATLDAELAQLLGETPGRAARK